MNDQEKNGITRRQLMARVSVAGGAVTAGGLAGGSSAFGASTGAVPDGVRAAAADPVRMGMFLPKTPPTDEVVVLDVSQDLAGRDWAAKEALLACVAIQGLVNRTSASKIYFTYTPQEHYWAPYPADAYALADGLVPARHTTPRLDDTKRYPVLSHLLAAYGTRYLRGMVRYPSLSSTVVDGAVTGAVTAAGVLDGLPVSPAIEAYLAGQGYPLEVLADTRELTDNVVAYHWTKERFLDRTTRTLVGQHSWTAFGGGVVDQVPVFYDEFIAHRVFVLSLDANREEERELIPDLLNPDNFPPGTPVIGLPVDEGQGLLVMEEAGYYFTIANTPNTTVTSSFEAEPARTRPAPAAPLSGRGCYVSFYATDGDSIGFSTNWHYHWWREVQDTRQSGQEVIPISWSFSPLLIDLFPTMLRWRTTHNLDGDWELVSNFNDGGAPVPQRGRDEYIRRHRTYMDASRGSLRTVNYFYKEGPEGGDEVATGLGRPLTLRYYNIDVPGEGDGRRAGAYTLDDGRLLTIDLTGKTQTEATVAAIEKAVRDAIAAGTEGEPVFAAVCVGEGRFQDVPGNVAKAVEALRADPQGRELHFIPPSALEATWRAHHQG